MSEVFDDVEGFAAVLPPMSALMGLDLGTKTIGVAVSDTFRSVATPLETVRRKKFGVEPAGPFQKPACRGISCV